MAAPKPDELAPAEENHVLTHRDHTDEPAAPPKTQDPRPKTQDPRLTNPRPKTN
jgi:hypothetical protein